MTEQVLDIRGALRILRRFRVVLVAVLLLGGAAGVALAVRTPPTASSTALVLLPPAPGADSGQAARDAQTQVAIATSSPVLDAAAKAVRPPARLSALRHAASAASRTQDIVAVRVTAVTAQRAEALTNAVAAAFVGYLNKTATDSTTGAVEGLQQTAAGLSKQIGQLQDEIGRTTRRLAGEDPTSPDGRRDASLIASLRAAQANLSGHLQDVSNQTESLQSSAGATSQTSARVLQPATPDPAAGAARIVSFGLAAGGVAFLVVVFVVLLTAKRDRRLRARDHIADAVGRSVVASISARPQRNPNAWASLLSTYRASSLDAWTLRKLLHQLEVDERAPVTRSVTVVSLAGDQAALAAGPQLASFAASLDVPTALSLGGYHTSAAPLWSACTLSANRSGRVRTNLAVCDGGVEPPDDAVLNVVVVVADRATPQLGALRDTSSTWLAVSAGFASADDLARLAIAFDDSGRTLDGVIVVNADASDRTTGFYPGHRPGFDRVQPSRVAGITRGIHR